MDTIAVLLPLKVMVTFVLAGVTGPTAVDASTTMVPEAGHSGVPDVATGTARLVIVVVIVVVNGT